MRDTASTGGPLRLVAYLRVSTERQADRGYGLDVQETGIRLWARRRHKLVAWCVDEGVSGASLDRPGLAEAIAAVQDGRASGIVVWRLDRLARELIQQEVIRAEVIRAGGQLRSCVDEEDRVLQDDPDDPTGQLVRQILGAIAEYERSMIRLRMRAGKARKLEAGGYAHGQPPYGYRADGGELVPVEDEQQRIVAMVDLRRQGRSYRAIADRLNEIGWPTRHGKAWSPQGVSRVIMRAGATQPRATALVSPAARRETSRSRQAQHPRAPTGGGKAKGPS